VSVLLDDDEEPIRGLLPDGRPDPAYAAGIGLVSAPLGRRALAFAIDAVVVVILTLPILIGALPLLTAAVGTDATAAALVSDPRVFRAVIFAAVGQGLVSLFLLVQIVLHGLFGRTLGKKIVGIRSVNVARFDRPGFWRIVLRSIVFAAAYTIVPYLGAIPFLLSPLWDRDHRGRGWLDRIGGTWLIDVRRGLDPFDLKALRFARKEFEQPAREEAVRMPSLATGAEWSAPTFVPAARSSFGVVAAPHVDEAGEAWDPPPIGTAEPETAAVTPVVSTPSAPSAPPPAPAAPSAAEGLSIAATLVLDDGQRLEVRGSGLVGRNPEPSDGESPSFAHRIDDPSMQMSKTHARVGIDAGGVWIRDNDSSNGTSLVPPGGQSLTLSAGAKTYVQPGSKVTIGGRSFTVVVGTTAGKATT
jgi:uncharacterized RDD family membrane protein YckC